MLDCLGGNSSWAPGYFQADTAENVFAAFRTYVLEMSREWAKESDPMVSSLLAAARLLTGDWTAAQVIADHLPAKAIKLDHGAGACQVVPFQAMALALPLPPSLKEPTKWLAASPEEVALRSWLAEHGKHLRWLEEAGVYALSP